MVSSIVKSSSIKFEYEDREDNYWKFYTNKVERVDDGSESYHHEHHRNDEQLILEMKILVPDVGIVTQKFEVSFDMFNELSNWLYSLKGK